MIHEKPQKPKMPGKIKLIFVIFIVVLIALTGWFGYSQIQHFMGMAPPPPGPAPVIVTNVQQITFADKIESVGTAQSDESTEITSSESEIVSEILFEEGQKVQKGDLLVRLKSDEESATFLEAEKNFDRYQQLAKTNAGSKAQRDQAKAMLDIARARVQDRRITAPFDGIVGLRSISVGDLVTPGTLITTIDDIDPIKLEFSVPEKNFAVLRPGLTVSATTPAYPGLTFEGVIETVDTRVDPQTRAVRVQALIDNSDEKLLPGLLMTVAIIRNERRATAIPEDAILSEESVKSVMVVSDSENPETGEQNTIAEKREVQIGARRPGYVEILSGLNVGDRVIIEGLQKAKPGQPVSITETRTIGDQIDAAIEYSVPRKQESLQQMQETGDLPDGEDQPAPKEQE